MTFSIISIGLKNDMNLDQANKYCDRWVLLQKYDMNLTQAKSWLKKTQQSLPSL